MVTVAYILIIAFPLSVMEFCGKIYGSTPYLVEFEGTIDIEKLEKVFFWQFVQLAMVCAV